MKILFDDLERNEYQDTMVGIGLHRLCLMTITCLNLAKRHMTQGWHGECL